MPGGDARDRGRRRRTARRSKRRSQRAAWREQRANARPRRRGPRKIALLQRAWVNLTASSAEGWSLTVMEAAACATPSVALAIGGLPESIEHGRTGLLADTTEDLVAQTRAAGRGRWTARALGRGARERAEEFSWERTADAHACAAERGARGGRPRAPLREQLARGDTGRAAGLAGAVMASNLLALVFTIVFARLLGADGYGSLARLVSTFLILAVVGSALQITVAREVSQAIARGAGQPGAGVRRWLQARHRRQHPRQCRRDPAARDRSPSSSTSTRRGRSRRPCQPAARGSCCRSSEERSRASSRTSSSDGASSAKPPGDSCSESCSWRWAPE